MSQSRCSDAPSTIALPLAVRTTHGAAEITDADGQVVATMEGHGSEPCPGEIAIARELAAARNCRDALIAVVEREIAICAVLPNLRGREDYLRRLVRQARGEG